MSNLVKAQIMYKLVRKNNWGNKYDRLEHFKRFLDLDKEIRELGKWIIIRKKPQYTGISLDTKYKKEIIEFIEKYIPDLKDMGWVK